MEELLAHLAEEGVEEDNLLARFELQEDISTHLAIGKPSGDFFYYAGNGTLIPLYSPSRSDFHTASWISKKCKQVKNFVKKHKKEILIGVAVVTAIAIVVTVVVLTGGTAAPGAAATGAALGGAAAAGMDNKPSSESIKTAMDDEIAAMKQIIADDIKRNSCTIEESARSVASILAHETIEKMNRYDYLRTDPNYDFHSEINSAFHTPYSSTYTSSPSQDFTQAVYQYRGEMALQNRSYDFAIENFNQAIANDPNAPLAYLNRGMAHFQLGQYDQFLHDFREFTQKKPISFSTREFTIGFAKGLPSGIYDSAEGMFLLVSDLVTHPIQTAEQMYDAFGTLCTLAKTEGWGAIGEALAPEVAQLIQEWDTLPSEKRGELAGYAFGKYGADILAPGAVAKAAKAGFKGAQQLGNVLQKLQATEMVLVQESVAGLGNAAKIGEIVPTMQKNFVLGEELGFSSKEMLDLKTTGQLQPIVEAGLEKLVLQTESEVLKKALTENKHIKMVRDYLGKSSKEIEKGISSYEKQIFLHKDKIANPKKYYPHWDDLDSRQREALINKKWPVEIKVYEEQKDVLQSILNERLSGGE